MKKLLNNIRESDAFIAFKALIISMFIMLIFMCALFSMTLYRSPIIGMKMINVNCVETDFGSGTCIGGISYSFKYDFNGETISSCVYYDDTRETTGDPFVILTARRNFLGITKWDCSRLYVTNDYLL